MWERHPDCELVVTGMRPGTVAALLEREGLAAGDGRIHAVGYVERDRLLQLYADASALLIPLFDDLRSRARFPTKVGEYLASARPVVTTAVGEMERFLTDRDTALVSPPGDPAAFAENLIAVLDDPELAARIGDAGRGLAEDRFEYSRQGPALRAFLDDLCGAPGGPAAAEEGTAGPREARRHYRYRGR